MSDTQTATPLDATAPVRDTSLTGGQLPTHMATALFVVSCAVCAGVGALLGSFHLVQTLVIGSFVFLAAIFALSLWVEGRRRAVNRLTRYLIFGCFILALIPLTSILIEVIGRGWNRLDIDFFSQSKRNIVGAGGGAGHAIMGTLIVTGLATLFSVPVGLFTAIYMVEYSRGLAKKVLTFLVDVMTGIPSIVAGLFAYALFALVLGVPSKSGLAGATALSVLMIPYVVRSSEEIIALVPNSLREASYALGVTKWATIVKVVLPTSISGIVSGIILAIARVIGETAPLLVTMGLTDSMNHNPMPTGANPTNPMTSLPVFVFTEYQEPHAAYIDRAWTAALILVLIVVTLNLLGRLISKRFAPKLNR